MEKKSILNQVLPTEINTVEQDSFDKSSFHQMKDAAEPIQKAEDTGQGLLKTFKPLMEDVFAGLYKYSPKVREPGTIKASHRVNHSLINKAQETEQWNQLRNYTKLDPVNSAMATVTIANKLADIIKAEFQDEADQANKCLAAEEMAAKAQANYTGLCDILTQTQGTAQHEKFKKQCAAAKKAAAAAQKAADAAAAKIEQAMPGAQQKMRQAIRVAGQAALNEVKETSELLESWGSEPGSVQQLPIEKRLELAQKLTKSDKMKKLAQLVGRFRRLAVNAQKSKVNRSQEEIYDLEQGNDLNRIIPSELGLLRNPATKLEFGRKFTEGKLMQYKLRGNERVGKGPIICCVDSSGSMSGNKELWSKAVALGLLEIAQMQRRNYAAIQFGSRSDELDIVVIEKGEKNIIDKVIHIAEYFLGGGTDFEKPLNAAAEVIKSAEFKKGDVVFITDGESEVSNEWLNKFLELKKQKEFRVHAVLCDYGNTSTTTVEKFSDQISSTSELTNSDAREIFSEV